MQVLAGVTDGIHKQARGFRPVNADCGGMRLRLLPIFLFDQLVLTFELPSNPTLAQVQPPLLPGPEA